MESNMNNTVTFKCGNGKYEFTVKDTFLKVVPKPEEMDPHTLIVTHKLPEYIHNPVGPATRHFFNKDGSCNHQEFWINGKRLSPEAQAKLEHDSKFNDKILDILK